MHRARWRRFDAHVPAEDPTARFGWSYGRSARFTRTDSIASPFGGAVLVADLLP